VCKLSLSITRFEIVDHRIRNQCKSCRLEQLHVSRKKRENMVKIIPTNKICKRCSISKSSDQFNKKLISSDGLSHICKECTKSTRCKKASDSISEDSSKFVDCGKCNLRKPASEFKTNKKAKSGYFSTCNSCWKPRVWNKEKQKLSEQKYVSKNPDKIKAKNAKQAKNPQRIMKQRLSARIKCALESVSSYKNNKTVHYIGCNMKYFKNWLEYQFVEGMNWNNRSEWHIDHVRPCASFNLLIEEEQKQCFSWKNMRPCWKHENMEKGDKIQPDLIASHTETVKRFLEVNPLPT